MDCAAICLLASAVQFFPLPTTINCTYCVETRSTYEHCFKDVIDCAYRDPSSLIFCLNVFEKNGGDAAIIQHTIRCISYRDHFVSDNSIKQIAADGSCAFEHIKKCECNTCRSTRKTINGDEIDSQFNVSIHRKEQHHHYHKNMSSHHHKHNQLVYPNNSFAQKYRNSGYYLKSKESFFSIYSILLFAVVVAALA